MKINQASQKYNIPSPTLRKLCASGQIKASKKPARAKGKTKVWHLDEASLQAYLQKGQEVKEQLGHIETVTKLNKICEEHECQCESIKEETRQLKDQLQVAYPGNANRVELLVEENTRLKNQLQEQGKAQGKADGTISVLQERCKALLTQRDKAHDEIRNLQAELSGTKAELEGVYADYRALQQQFPEGQEGIATASEGGNACQIAPDAQQPATALKLANKTIYDMRHEALREDADQYKDALNKALTAIDELKADVTRLERENKSLTPEANGINPFCGKKAAVITADAACAALKANGVDKPKRSLWGWLKTAMW